jgi:SAM-dependent methyltransferase
VPLAGNPAWPPPAPARVGLVAVPAVGEAEAAPLPASPADTAAPDPGDPSEQPAVADVDWARVEFVDLGCSRGASLRWCAERLAAGPGIGVDLDPRKVAAARAGGHEAVVGDATDLCLHDEVRFVSMMDFLEHLPTLEIVEAVLASAAEAATDFLYVYHPSFEGEEYLRLLGLQQYWHAWTGHTAHVRIADYCAMLERLGLRRYAIRYDGPVVDSAHDSVHSRESGANQGPYDPARHPPKPLVRFERPLWRAQHLVVALRDFERTEWDDVVTRLTAEAPARATDAGD